MNKELIKCIASDEGYTPEELPSGYGVRISKGKKYILDVYVKRRGGKVVSNKTLIWSKNKWVDIKNQEQLEEILRQEKANASKPYIPDWRRNKNSRMGVYSSWNRVRRG